MEVRVDGVLFVPLSEALTDKNLINALDVRFNSDAGDNITIRDYLRLLLETLWCEQESFNSKRPFGTSGWYLDLATPLVTNGYITGNINEDGYAENINGTELSKFVTELIYAMCYGVKQNKELT